MTLYVNSYKSITNAKFWVAVWLHSVTLSISPRDAVHCKWGYHPHDLQVRPVGRFSCLMAQTTWTRARIALWGFIYIAVHLRGQIPPKPWFWGANRHFQAKRACVHVCMCMCVWMFYAAIGTLFRWIKLIKKFKLSYFRNYCINPPILHRDKDRQVSFVDGPNMPPNKSKMAVAAIFKNQKIVISQKPFDWFWQNLTRWCISALWLPS